jgi:multiple antibiotic resistance protein
MNCFQYFIGYFTKLFVVISPLAIIALFVSMTAHYTVSRRIRTAKVGSIVAYFTMLFFAIFGQEIFIFLGITMGAFNIAGGTILLLMGLSMLRAEDPEEPPVSKDEISAVAKEKPGGYDIAITPFGIPIICGPGCITTVITLQDEAHGFLQNVCGLAALTVVGIVLYSLLVFSAHGTKWLTPMVLKLSYRLSGIVLVALAMQMILTGIKHNDGGLIRRGGAQCCVECPAKR